MSSFKTGKQLTLFVTFYIKPHLTEEWKTAHRPVWEACAREPNCIIFDVFQDLSRLGRFRLFEVWNADLDWFKNEQIAKPYYTKLWEESEWTYEAPREIEFFEKEGEGCSYRHLYFAGGKQMD